MSARDELIEIVTRDPQSSGGDQVWATDLVDSYRAEVVADRDAEIVRWLGKKAREYRAKGGGLVTEAAAEVIGLMASKISRGAVRPDNTRLPAGVEPRFFEPGRTYQRAHHGQPVTFRVTAVSTSPDGCRTVAHGWRTDPYSGWEPTDSDDITGWTDITEGGAS